MDWAGEILNVQKILQKAETSCAMIALEFDQVNQTIHLEDLSQVCLFLHTGQKMKLSI